MFPFGLARAKERVVLIEVLPAKIEGAVVKFDSEKRITLEKVFSGHSWEGLSRALRGRRAHERVVVAADSSLAATAIIPVSVIREKAAVPLGGTELENLLSQTVGKVFNQCRDEASRELLVDDLDVILVRSRVADFKVDGHRVVNPLGFRAKRIDAVLELTFTTRELFRGLKTSLKTAKRFFFTEIGRAELNVLARISPAPLSLLELGAPHSLFFVLGRVAVGNFVYRGKLPWTPRSYLDVITKNFALSERAAMRLYHAYLLKRMSPSAIRHLSRLFEPVTKGLFAAIQKTRLKGRVYLDTPLPLPFPLPARRRLVTLEEPPLEALLEKFGFSLEKKESGASRGPLVRRLAPFLEYYHDESDTTMNHWLRRYLHWLGSPM